MWEAPKNIDYVTKDYEGFLQLMKALIPSRLPNWTDFSESDFGITLLELTAYGLHILSFYQDKSINERFPSTARINKSIIEICRFLGYEISSQVPSTATVTFTKYTDSLNTEIKVPKGTLVSTDPNVDNSPILFETNAELTISSGTASASVNVTQGQTIPSYVIGVGDNSENQEFTLEIDNVLMNTLEIFTLENGVNRPWIKVDDFLDSITSDRHFTASITGDYYTKITFGDGTSGMRVPQSAPVYAQFRVGGGVRGNVGTGKINYLPSDITGIETISNANSASGGVDYENLEKAKLLAPKIYRSGRKAVTPNDFEAIACSVSGVLKAKLEESFNANADVKLYIVPTNFGTPNNTLLQSVVDTVSAPDTMVINNHLTAVATTYILYDVAVSVTIDSTYKNADKQTEIDTLLTDFALNPLYFSHGEEVSTSYIVGSIMGVTGVKKVAVTINKVGQSAATDLTCGTYEFLKYNSIAVTVTGGI